MKRHRSSGRPARPGGRRPRAAFAIQLALLPSVGVAGIAALLIAPNGIVDRSEPLARHNDGVRPGHEAAETA